MKASPSAELAPVMRALLEPVLAPVSSGRLVGELSAALEVVRAGVSIARGQPEWMLALDSACAQLQRMIKPALRARSIAHALLPSDLPKPLRADALDVKKRALKEAKLLARQLNSWRQSEEGQRCRVAIRRALKQGEKSKPFVLADTQIDECLSRGEAILNKRLLKVRKNASWSNLNKHGRAARQQRLTQQFICLLGHEIESEELNQVIARYRGLTQTRRAGRWLKNLLETAALDVGASAATGALWTRVQIEQRHLEREIFLASVPAAPIDPSSNSKRPRPEFPLRLRFGTPETEDQVSH